MKAVVQTRYGEPHEVLEVREVDEPRVGEREVLVRVRAASVHADVWHVVRGYPWILRLMGSGLRRPSPAVPGTDLAGTVEAVGPGVTRFAPGDAVFGESRGGSQWTNGGAWAELAAVPEDELALKPEGVSFEQAASVPTAGNIAIANLRGRASVQPGQRVLVNGAAGGVGSVALQIAKARGARVTGVDHTDKLDLLRSLGADEVIDYTRQDATDGSGGARYDLVFDVASTMKPSACKHVLTPHGVYVVIGHDHYGTLGRRLFGSVPQMIWLMVRGLVDRHLPRPDFSLPAKPEVMAELHGLLTAGALTPAVDRTFPLDAAAEALGYLQTGRAAGKVLLTP